MNAPLEMRPLSPAAAALLGFLFPGGGHIYCGQRRTGTIILVIGVCTGFLCGLMNVWAAWASWHLARRQRIGLPLTRRRPGGYGGARGSALETGGEILGDILD